LLAETLRAIGPACADVFGQGRNGSLPIVISNKLDISNNLDA
jgi:hypothetical protein